MYVRRDGSARYSTEEIRPVNELKMRARWKLGRVLADCEREGGPGRGKKKFASRTSFSGLLKTIGLKKVQALVAQRIGTLPESELEKAFAQARKDDGLVTYTFAANAAGGLNAAIAATCRRTRSAANTGNCSYCPCAQRYSINMLRPST